MSKLTLTTLTNLDTAVATINTNNTAIIAAVEKTLSRDGTSPNSMSEDLDMDGNQILNLPAPVVGADPATKTYVDAEALRLENLIDDIIVAEDRATGVVGPSSSTNNRLVQFQGTTGQILKEYTGTGIVSTSNGVPGSLSLPTGVIKSDGTQFQAAVAGTDYLAPAAIGVTVQGYDATTLKSAAIGTTVQAYNANLLKTGIVWVIGDGVNVITTGSKHGLTIPFACTITEVILTSDQTGSIVVDIKKSTFSGFPTTSSICSSTKPTLSSARKYNDSTLTSWTKTIASNDFLEFNVDSISTLTKVTIQLSVTRT